MISLQNMLPFELTKDTPYLALSGELWSVFYEYFNRNWSCYKGFLLYCDVIRMPLLHHLRILFLACANWHEVYIHRWTSSSNINLPFPSFHSVEDSQEHISMHFIINGLGTHITYWKRTFFKYQFKLREPWVQVLPFSPFTWTPYDTEWVQRMQHVQI